MGPFEKLVESRFAESDSQLTNILGKDWPSVRTPADLRKRLSSAADRLDSLGDSHLASKWRDRLKNMPASMNKESINAVLLSAWQELATAGHVTGI